jgi:acyl carrier protein
MDSALTSSSIHHAVLEALAGHNKADCKEVVGSQDIFLAYGMTSLDMFRAIAALEKAFDVEIGEKPSEFDQIRTLTGLVQLINDKLDASAATSG